MRVASFMLIASFALLGQSPFATQPSATPKFHAWSQSELQQMADALRPQMDEHHFKSQTLATTVNHRFLITHREGEGQSEWHEHLSDIMFVQSGSAKLIYGGKMVNSVTTEPGEQRGKSIDGGLERVLHPGDVVVIPPAMPHQINATTAEPIDYFVVKIHD